MEAELAKQLYHPKDKYAQLKMDPLLEEKKRFHTYFTQDLQYIEITVIDQINDNNFYNKDEES